ncbi:MAG: hypothetical protein LQ348_001268 [Seirophora lacunosa]|nr:MAG: hypothetical protein LQ348_001268 [Seirophora lacunosa]
MNSFQNLSRALEDMPTTRSQRARGRVRSTGRGRGGPASSQGNTAPVLPVQGHSGLLQAISSTSAARASQGITADFFVDRVRRHESGRGAYFAFQVNRPASVRIYNPIEEGQDIECTCEDFQTTRAICIHIYWLIYGLNALLDTSTASSSGRLGRTDIVTRASAIYGLIGTQLPSLPTMLNATHGDLASDSDDAVEAILSPTFPHARADQVCDMLSVFDTGRLPDEFGRDFAPVPSDEMPHNFYVPHSLAATIYRLAVRDESVFRRLRRVITHDVCANAHFSKLRARAREAFARLDSYVEDGPTPDNNQDIPRCARSLRSIVNEICQTRNIRTSSGPLSTTVVMKVAEILVEILQEVCNRNEEAYYRIHWEREASEEEPERNRNLYAYLIDDPPPFSASTPSWMKETFVIDRLRQMPANEWRHLIERLTTILDQIRDGTPAEDAPPVAYTKLDTMIQDYTAEAFEPSSSSVQRRPTLGDQRESQRRRLE